MDVIKKTIAYSDAYSGSIGLKSILKQSIDDANKLNLFPFNFSINCSWNQNDINTVSGSFSGYSITFDTGSAVFTINKQ